MANIDTELSKFMVDMVKNQPEIPKELDLFLVTKESYIRFHNGFFNTGKNYVDTVLLQAKKLNLDRGEILSVFSKMEVLLYELIHLIVIDYDTKKRVMFDDILDNINLHRKIELLRKWELISNNECDNFQKLKSVRNGFAHAWNKKEVYYKDKPIEENFDDFKKDLENMWFIILDIYKKEQTKIDLDEIRKKLGLPV